MYVETTVVSYLVARPGGSAATRKIQQATRLWWYSRDSRDEFRICEEVVRECSQGDPREVVKRIEVLRLMLVIGLTAEMHSLADILLRRQVLPLKAKSDAVHLASAAVYGVELLVTWNMRHLANPKILPRVRDIISGEGLRMPRVCTPLALLEMSDGGG